MAERRIINGYIVERGDDGRIHTIGPANTAPQMPADPGFQYEGPKAGADLQGKQISNQVDAATAPYAGPTAAANAAAAAANAETARYGNPGQGYRWRRDPRGQLIMGADGQPMAEKIPGTKSPNDPPPQTLGNIMSVVDQINHIEALFDKYQKGVGLGSIGEYLPTQGNMAFDTAGAALGDMGTAAFKAPGMGPQSDADAARFVAANQPSRWDSDSQVKEKLGALRRRVERTLEAMGQPAPKWGTQYDPARTDREGVPAAFLPDESNGAPPAAPDAPTGPAVLPRAAGAQADPGIGPTGVTSEGGLRYEQGLAGLPDAVANMVGQGAQASEITAFLNQQYAPFGASVGPDMAAAIGTLVQRHRADPRAPVKSLSTGWENFTMLPGRQESTMLGRAADTDLGNFVMHGANAATAGLPGYLAGDQGAAVLDASSQARPLSSLAGEVVGGTAAMAGAGGLANAATRSAIKPISMLGRGLTRGGYIGNDIAYGATRGGFENGPTGALTGALAAGVGNKIGSGIANTTGRVIRGVSDPAVNALAERGIPMSLGSLLGNRSIPGKLINRFESAPVIGDMFAARRADSIDAFNREAFNDAVAPLGGKVASPGREGMNEALGIVDEGYRNALGDAAIDTADPGFRDALSGSRARMEGIPTIGQELAYNFDNNVAPLFEGGLNGERLQSALRSLREMQAGYAGKPMGQAARDAVGEAEGAVRNLVQTQRPDVLPKLDAANQAYRNVSTLADAVNAATNNKGVFTPAQLGRSAVNNTKKFGGRMKAAKGDVPFADLQAAAQEVLPSAYPDSGTAGRVLSAALPTVLGGSGLAAGALADPTTATTLGALALLSSKSGAKIAQKALTGRGPTARAIGTKLVNQRRKAGLFGASAGVAMLPQFSQ